MQGLNELLRESNLPRIQKEFCAGYDERAADTTVAELAIAQGLHAIASMIKDADSTVLCCVVSLVVSYVVDFTI